MTPEQMRMLKVVMLLLIVPVAFTRPSGGIPIRLQETAPEHQATVQMYPLTGTEHAGLALLDVNTVAIAGLNADRPQAIALLTLGDNGKATQRNPFSFTFKQVAATERGPDGTLWVCDTLDNRILIFNLKTGKLTKAVDTAGMPIHMRVRDDGTAWYVTRDMKVHRYAPDDRTFLLVNSDSTPVTLPPDTRDIALSPTGVYMYVACLSQQQIMRVDLQTGGILPMGMSKDASPGRMLSSIDVDSDGYIYASDSARNQIMKFSQNGDHITNLPPGELSMRSRPSLLRVQQNVLVWLAAGENGQQHFIRLTIAPGDPAAKDGPRK